LSRITPTSLAVLLALTSSARAQPANQSGDARFDGAAVRKGGVAVPDAPAGGGSADQSEKLFQALMARVTVRPDPSSREAAAIRDAFREMLKTQTGSELAQRFVNENAHGSVGFGDTGGSAVVEQNGIKVMQGSGGYTETSKTPPSVMLNQQFLETDPNYQRVEIARVLTHELMGHGFERQRVAAAGLSPDAMYYYRADEGNASMVGWLVQAELGGKLINGHMWNYLTDPEKFYKGIQFLDPYYATTLSAQEMLDPVPVWKDRLSRLGEARAGLDDDQKEYTRWKAIIQHFATAHGIGEERFKNLSGDIGYTLDTYVPSARERLTETDKTLNEAINRALSPSGATLLADMRTAGQSAYVAGQERRMNDYAARLRADVGTRQRETAAPPDPAQVTWSELEKIWKEDYPAHRAQIP
jgi:hypothetical protein